MVFNLFLPILKRLSTPRKSTYLAFCFSQNRQKEKTDEVIEPHSSKGKKNITECNSP